MAGPESTLASSASYAHFLSARLAHDLGNHRLAADELHLALASEPGNAYLMTELGEEYARLGQVDRAERQLAEVVERHPRYAPGLLMLGRVLLDHHKAKRAKLFLRRAIRLDSREPEQYLLLAQAELELAHPKQAVAAVTEMTRATGEPLGLKRLGQLFGEKGNPAGAEPLLLHATQMDPQDGEAWFALAQVEDALGKETASEAAFTQALEHDPDNADALLAAGRVALKVNAVPEARADFDRLLSLSSDAETVVKVAFSYLGANQLSLAAKVLDDARREGSSEPRLAFYAGLVHEKAGHFGKAAEAFAAVPKDSGLRPEAQLHLGMALSQEGKQHEAVALLSDANHAHPGEPGPTLVLAQVLERGGDPVGAERLLRHTLMGHPSPELYEALADLLERTGRIKEAIALLRTGLAARPQDQLLHFTLATAFEKSGDVDGSLAQMRQVLALDPDNAAAMNFIGYMLAERGDGFAEAERLLLRALQLKPESGAFLDSLGWLYFRRGEVGRAVGTLERAAALSPEEPVISEHLGDAYRGVSKDSEAAAAYRRALEALSLLKDADSGPRREALEGKLKLLSSEARAR